MEKIKVLVVDDSYFMRDAISRILKSDGDIEVVETARDGKEAVLKACKCQPDVITMDIEMPVMNGIQAVAEIMKQCPTPIIMVSTLTTEGADATMEALSVGAVDFLTKKTAFREMDSMKDELIQKVRLVGSNSDIKNSFIRRRLLRAMQNSKSDPESPKKELPSIRKSGDSTTVQSGRQILERKKPFSTEIRIIAIGISTGGPVALQQVMKAISGEIPVPIVIAQHMPPFFTNSLAARLNSMSELSVSEAVNDEKMLPGHVYLAPGGLQMAVNKSLRIIVNDERVDSLYKPSVDHLMTSVTNAFGKNAVGINMTGMGNDGLRGLRILSEAGGYVMAQDPDTCVVAGMTKSIIEAGIVNEIVSLKNMAETISSFFGLHASNV